MVALETNRVRWLEATDPLNQKERVEFHSNLALPLMETPIPNIPAPPLPHVEALVTNLMRFRNSFYWDKKAMAEAPGDYSKARRTHWLHRADANVCSGTVESEKNPIENRVWYTYPGQSGAFSSSTEGSMNRPSIIARVLGINAHLKLTH